MLFFHSMLLAAAASFVAADNIQFSWCNYCSPPTSPGGQPNCNNAVYQHNGDGDGDCNSFATYDIADGGCTPSDSVDTPRGEGSYVVYENCEGSGVGETKGSIILKADANAGYDCSSVEGTYTNACGLTFACTRFLECYGY
jgi:hypothetical protein